MANSVDPDQTAPIGAVCSGPTLFASILNSSVMLGNYLQQTTSTDDIFRCIFFGNDVFSKHLFPMVSYEGRSICNENSPVYPKVLYLHTS